MKNRKVGFVLLALLAIPAALFSYDSSPGHDIVIPECIWAPATGGGTWVTEVQITNMTSGSIVTAVFYYGTSWRIVSNIWTPAGIYRSIKYTNILSTLQSLDPSFTYYGKVGTLWLSTQDDAHKIQAMARTLNGNYGKTFPGLPWTDGNTANLGRNMMIMNLTQNATYRTFVGFFNAISGGYSMTVQFGIINQNNGTVGAFFTKTIPAWNFISFNPFVEAGVGAGIYDNCWLWINVTSSGSSGADTHGLFCFGSSANNATNDSAAHIAYQFQ